jgi:hypothetical protein
MSTLPPALDFPAAEEEICRKWKDEHTFRRQDELSLERGDPVRLEKEGGGARTCTVVALVILSCLPPPSKAREEREAG